MYDLQSDPSEFTNQANNPEYSEALTMMQTRLLQTRVAAGFQGAITQAHAERKPRKKSKKQ